MAKIITVLGATGNQGGSVVKALLKESSFRVRGVTRNVESERATSLVQRGVDMVKVTSLDDSSSLEQAFNGSYGVFAVTNFWEIFDEAKEVQWGKNIIDAAKKAGVQHVIYSGVPSVKKFMGQACPHFDGKALVEEYLFQSGLPYATSVRYAAYMENLFTALIPQKTGESEYTWNVPMEGKHMNMVSVASAGSAVAAIFRDPGKYRGKAIGLSGDRKTIPEYCDIMNKYVAPSKIIPGTMTAEQFSKLGFPGAAELGVMFAFYQAENEHYSTEQTKLLDPETIDFEGFVEANREKLVALLK